MKDDDGRFRPTEIIPIPELENMVCSRFGHRLRTHMIDRIKAGFGSELMIFCVRDGAVVITSGDDD